MRAEAIIPAFNEERTVGVVVKTALACPLLSAVHVIDDGSRDGTSAAAAAAGATVHRLEPNQGKMAALLEGEAVTRAEILVLLDADLLGLTPEHIEAMLAPVMGGQAIMSVGVFQAGRRATDLSQYLTPFLNGQRALRRQVLAGLAKARNTRYAADTLLSLYAHRMGEPVVMVPLFGLTHVMKEEKIGWARGVLSRLRMFYQVFRALFVPLPTKERIKDWQKHS